MDQGLVGGSGSVVGGSVVGGGGGFVVVVVGGLDGGCVFVVCVGRVGSVTGGLGRPGTVVVGVTRFLVVVESGSVTSSGVDASVEGARESDGGTDSVAVRLPSLGLVLVELAGVTLAAGA
nr:hypothetical protein [Actinomycetota bacterium]